MSLPRIGDRAKWRNENGVIFEGTVLDIRPKMQWLENPEINARSEWPEGDYVFIGTLGWPHMAMLPREDYVRQDERGVWRGSEEVSP